MRRRERGKEKFVREFSDTEKMRQQRYDDGWQESFLLALNHTYLLLFPLSDALFPLSSSCEHTQARGRRRGKYFHGVLVFVWWSGAGKQDGREIINFSELKSDISCCWIPSFLLPG